MSLFLQTRTLTQSREDPPTCFVAAALDLDAAFRDVAPQVGIEPGGVSCLSIGVSPDV